MVGAGGQARRWPARSSRRCRAVTTTGCATLNSKSQASGYLVVSKYALGVPYRVRADYIRGKDTSNLDADSGFLSFMVER